MVKKNKLLKRNKINELEIKVKKIEDKEKLKIELSRLYAELEDLKKVLPAHTIRPHQLIAIEDIEYRINEIEKKLKD